jgi:hypothetical protein
MEVKEYMLDDDITVLYVQAETFPQGIQDSFKKLHDITGGFEGRHMYGITLCLGYELVYRACIKENLKSEGEQYGLKTYTIPKGTYLYTTLNNWQENIGQIPSLFDALMALPNVKKQTICLEDYAADGKMLAMVQQA